jgi:hypothetical protein
MYETGGFDALPGTAFVLFWTAHCRSTCCCASSLLDALVLALQATMSSSATCGGISQTRVVRQRQALSRVAREPAVNVSARGSDDSQL